MAPDPIGSGSIKDRWRCDEVHAGRPGGRGATGTGGCGRAALRPVRPHRRHRRRVPRLAAWTAVRAALAAGELPATRHRRAAGRRADRPAGEVRVHRPELRRPRRRDRRRAARRAGHVLQGARTPSSARTTTCCIPRGSAQDRLGGGAGGGDRPHRPLPGLARGGPRITSPGTRSSNDVSEREFQIERSGGQWDKGKSCETFNPLGPWLVTAGRGGRPAGAARCGSWVNGELRQDSTTADMIFAVAHLIWYLSPVHGAGPGRRASTPVPRRAWPSPAGSRTCAAGDVVELEIDGLGRQRNVLV